MPDPSILDSQGKVVHYVCIIDTNEPVHTHTHTLYSLGSVMNVLIILCIPHHSAESESTDFLV